MYIFKELFILKTVTKHWGETQKWVLHALIHFLHVPGPWSGAMNSICVSNKGVRGPSIFCFPKHISKKFDQRTEQLGLKLPLWCKMLMSCVQLDSVHHSSSPLQHVDIIHNLNFKGLSHTTINDVESTVWKAMWNLHILWSSKIREKAFSVETIHWPFFPPKLFQFK